MSMIGTFLRVSEEQIKSLHAEPQEVEELIETASESGETFDVDKAWHCIHFLLGGDERPGPLGFILNGKALGDVEVGYGPPCLFDVAETAAIANALESITMETLRAKFLATRFDNLDIYPGAELWTEPVESCFDDYLAPYFRGLKDYVLKARDERAGMLVWLG